MNDVAQIAAGLSEVQRGLTPALVTDAARSRFWAKVDRRSDDECWPWTGKLTSDGYGSFTHVNLSRKAHRWSFVVNGRTIPSGNVIDHICRNRACVNPAHLRPVSAATNTMENSIAPTAINAKKTHCVHGHPLTADNLLPHPLRTKGYRMCKICQQRYKKKCEMKKAHLLEMETLK